MVCARCDDDFILIYPVLIKCDIYDQLFLSVQVWNCPCFVESAVACMRSSHDRLMETNSCRPDRGSFLWQQYMATKGPKLILFEWNFGYYDANKQDDDVIVNSRLVDPAS